ncbi:MAG: DUF488 family protein [Euryarchaeota archaeon]|nr:DUF488 family protein [Euryarchaeota archaeon]
MIRMKRVYEPASPTDGRRVLIDRLWPCGVTKSGARIDAWRRELAPSEALRRWYGHDPKRYRTFRERYRMELLRQRETVADLVLEAERGTLTLVFAAKDHRYSNARVLKELVEECSR